MISPSEETFVHFLRFAEISESHGCTCKSHALILHKQELYDLQEKKKHRESLVLQCRASFSNPLIV